MGISSQSSISDLKEFCNKNIKNGFKVEGKKYKSFFELKKKSLDVTKKVSKKYFSEFLNLQKNLSEYWDNSLRTLNDTENIDKFKGKFESKVRILLKEINNVAMSRSLDTTSFLSVYKSQTTSWNSFEKNQDLLEKSFEIIKNLEVESINKSNLSKITFLLEAVDNILNFEEITKENFEFNKSRVDALIKKMNNYLKLWQKGENSHMSNKNRKTNIKIGANRRTKDGFNTEEDIKKKSYKEKAVDKIKNLILEVKVGGKKYKDCSQLVKEARVKFQRIYNAEISRNLKMTYQSAAFNFKNYSGIDIQNSGELFEVPMEYFKFLEEIEEKLKAEINKTDIEAFSNLKKMDYKSQILKPDPKIPNNAVIWSIRVLENLSEIETVINIIKKLWEGFSEVFDKAHAELASKKLGVKRGYSMFMKNYIKNSDRDLKIIQNQIKKYKL